MDSSSERTAFANQYVDSLCWVLRDLPFNEIGAALELLEKALDERRQVFLIGNGGSASTASHMASDLMRGAGAPGKPGFRAIALSDNVPLITSIANDENYEQVFARQLAALGQPGDVLIVFSCSGNSPNVLRAVEIAREMHLNTIAFLGMGGGGVAALADISVIVPSNDYGPIEDTHLVFDHLITAYLRGGAAQRCEVYECNEQFSWTATGS